MSVRALNWAFDQHACPDGPWRLLMVLADLADDNGVVAGQARERLASRLGKSVDTIDRRLAVLADVLDEAGEPVPEGRGWLRIEHRRRPTAGGFVPLENVYRLHVPPLAHGRRSAAQDGAHEAALLRPQRSRKSAMSQTANLRRVQPQERGEVAASGAAPIGDSSLTEEESSFSSSPFPRPRGGDGGLGGDGGEIVALVNHPKLDPVKAPDLATTTNWIAAWRRLGLSREECARVICVVLEKRDRARPGADAITTWNFFTKAMREHAAAKAAAARLAQAPEPLHDVRADNFRPLNAAEREHAFAGDRRSSWGRVLAEIGVPPEPGSEQPEMDEAGGSARGGGGGGAGARQSRSGAA